MYTEVAYYELVDKTLARIGAELRIEFEQPSTADMLSYPTGKWLYEIDSSLRTRIFRWGTGEEQEVPGFHWTDEQRQFENRLENELRSAALKLYRIDAQ